MKTGFYKCINDDTLLFCWYDGSESNFAGLNLKTGEMSCFWKWSLFKHCSNQNELIVEHFPKVKWITDDVQLSLF